MQKVKRTDLETKGDEEAATTLKAWWLLGLYSSVSNLFPFVLYLCLFLAFSFLCVFVTLSTGSCTFFSPVLKILFAKTNGAKT
jgi:hypothetical protein